MELRGAVTVITGASSGLGRATALALAQKGGRVVVAARRLEPLEKLARSCEALGGSALAVVADVTDADALRRLVMLAVERFGRIDVWVNNAGVSSFGEFERTPDEVFR